MFEKVAGEIVNNQSDDEHDDGFDSSIDKSQSNNESSNTLVTDFNDSFAAA